MKSKSLWILLATAGFLGGNLVGYDRAYMRSPNAFASEAEANADKLQPATATQTAPNVVPERSRRDVLEQILHYSDPANSNGMSQVTSVSQLRDIRPTDWSFQALQSLVERYGCIAGYPDGSYRGNRALTRFEFAAGLNACLDRINELIAAATASTITRGDIATLQRLQEEFAAELATLRGRVDALEVRTAEIEANQFSTTTKLEGEVLFAFYGVAAGEDVNGNDIDQVTAFGHRSRLNFVTSFTGSDTLLTRLQTGNINGFATDTPEGSLFFVDESDNTFNLDALLYAFPVGENLEVVILGNAGASDEFASTVNPFFDGDGAFGALSTFATRHPIFYLIDNAGIGFRYHLGDKFELSGGYMATEPADPADGKGLFNGDYGAIGQLLFKPKDGVEIGLTYLHAYNNETGTGSNRSNFRSFVQDSAFGQAVPIISNAYGLQVSWQLSDKFVIGGWGGYINVQTLSSLDGQIGRGSLDIWNWAATLAFPDLFKEGNVAGILVGMEPKVTDSSVKIPGERTEDADTGLHIEAFYQWQLTDNISITPGLIWQTAPDHNQDNDDIVIGVIRTTFEF